MTFLTPLLIAASIAASSADSCASAVGRPSAQRVFTNADLDRMAACRLPSGAATVSPQTSPDPHPPTRRRAARTEDSMSDEPARREALEADWRARWRSIDQKARRLRREAKELRAEAAESPRDPKKRVVGRRSLSILITRAEALEAEANELVAEFEETARRRGALPGWLRPESR